MIIEGSGSILSLTLLKLLKHKDSDVIRTILPQRLDGCHK